MNLIKIDECRWEIPKTGKMRVPGIIYASEQMISHIIGEKAAEQVANVAALPGIIDKAMAMPDIHWGYGFPIGGVAAFDAEEGVISPGGIGYDINCGVRLLRTNLQFKEIEKKVPALVDALFTNIPSGVGSTGKLNLSKDEVMQVLEQGSHWAVKKGFGSPDDLAHTEEEGRMEGADGSAASSRALERGREQLGTLGAGNHFLEIQEVETIYDNGISGAFGLFEGQMTVMIHTGSRGLGYQICDDNLKILQEASRRYGIELPDRQLACAPVKSPEGRKYFSAMAGAANYAWTNRQIITHWVRETLMRALGKTPKELGLEVVYDVAHNIGKFEEHAGRKMIVHRKGATRAFSAGSRGIPDDYRATGQPVLIPGTMGTESYVLVGTEEAMKQTWGSTCHGAGRMMSRTQARHGGRGEDLAKELGKKGITVKADSWKTLAEEAPSAYKNVNEVVDICGSAGISRKVAKLKPKGVIKG
ncbi:MAG: RtcB family protein [Elusimicrobiota bacterium]